MQDAFSSQVNQELDKMLPTLVHALRTPLSGLAMGIEVAALRLKKHDDDSGFLQPMRNTLSQMTDALDQLTRFVRPRRMTVVLVDVDAFVRETIEAWSRAHPKARIVWQTEAATSKETKAFALDLDSVHQSIGHLLDNAFEAGKLAPIRVGLTHLTQTEPHRLCLTVGDAGSGIKDDDLARVTEPFFTTKCRQLGLGLAFVVRTAEGHRGRLDVQSDAAGTTVALHLLGLDDLVRHAPVGQA